MPAGGLCTCCTEQTAPHAGAQLLGCDPLPVGTIPRPVTESCHLSGGCPALAHRGSPEKHMQGGIRCVRLDVQGGPVMKG